jgi:hypothetical protein
VSAASDRASAGVSYGYRTHPQPTFCTTTKKKTRGKPGMRGTYFRSGPLQDRASSGGHVTDVTSDQKPTRADIAELPVVHAQNILRTGHVTDVTSCSTTAQHHRKY